VQEARNLAKIDTQVSDSGAVRHREVGGDPYQEFVQGESLRPKRDQLARGESGKTLHLGDRGDARRDILGSKYRRQVPQFPGHLRLDAGVPRPMHLRGVGGTHAHYLFNPIPRFAMVPIIPIPPIHGGDS
jgi:hypothetical protein